MNGIILLVEDDPTLRRSLERLIRRKGYEVAMAENGQRALDVLDELEEPPCMILLDLMMPVMDGWTFHERLLERPGDAAIPVIVLSGVADLQRQARVVNAESSLRKPVDLDLLYGLLDDYCSCA